jgi:acetyl-CoA acetyltransferase
MPNQPKGAIAGLGVTPMGKIYGRRAVDFAAEAIALALDDAGLNKSDVDGLLINANLSGDMDVRSQMVLGFEKLTLVNVMSAYGSTAGSMMQYACMAIREGLANVVVLVYADAPLSATRGAGQSYAGPHRFPLAGMPWPPGGICTSTAPQPSSSAPSRLRSGNGRSSARGRR